MSSTVVLGMFNKWPQEALRSVEVTSRPRLSRTADIPLDARSCAVKAPRPCSNERRIHPQSRKSLIGLHTASLSLNPGHRCWLPLRAHAVAVTGEGPCLYVGGSSAIPGPLVSGECTRRRPAQHGVRQPEVPGHPIRHERRHGSRDAGFRPGSRSARTRA
jgi:hypothetical protein